MATKTELSPTARESKNAQDMQVDETLIPRKVPSLCSARYGIALVLHFCNFTTIAQNVIMNITMVAMVNSTSPQSQLNDSSEVLPVDSFGGLSKAPKSLPAKSSILGGQFAIWEKWGPPQERSRLCSIALSGMLLGCFTAILIGGFISETLGWPFVFYIFGGVGCVCCLLWFVVIYDDPVSYPWISTSEKEYIISSLKQQVGSSKQPLPIKAMLRSLPIWSICLGCFSHQWLVSTMVVYIPTYISSVYHVNIRDNGLLSALPFIVAWVIGMVGGYLADFLLTKKFRLITVRKIATILGSLPSSALIVSLPYLNSGYITATALLTLSCGLSTLCQSGIYINVLDIAPRYSSFLMGASRGFSSIAPVIVPTVSGFLLSQDPEFGWRNVFFLLFAVNLLGLLFYLIFGEADVQEWAKERKLTRL
ncbi:sodium-dependent phosphate transport protein 4 isoform b [Homo sapiens]|uniref:Sodium-dependent phosphate transport protein 4 n=1 Tax=Homo sapiens TaxID=9606 RepID=NPT4_HUMAN|nr:sodium-dependent phosphate transport protein 4 isoform b [Homo sapiens]O00476.2 RecName: Full=Sodium-dependent phosphate transport protein 4; AltName: Full=Na(+)/PI cotransporter 4; Short=NPT4; AltName: Full=Sodium/phosphate cotransporter 4; AltName: Full=Solute carrier family 17 member 3 [Homo sapiens]EAW55495.1 solute carrier family 17 (sodium phosphate), member 3, isoform CRA_a [Homo sapiens]EAW55497.1 solute carrier family 17 (sodium phosphate), member 3, isoform CRA_a [Homo sapiens]|eukprot:NP_006623.2 sodium-dependent phosphate transport protein 4 isoform b [Homo sapiens]